MKGVLEKFDKMVFNDGECVRNRLKVSVVVDGEIVAVETMNASEDYGGEFVIEATRDGECIFIEMDNLVYCCLGVGFILFIVGLVFGVVWVNEVWGSYWFWDSKETWAFIIWFVYVMYLYLCFVVGWSKKDLCVVGVVGFLVVWVCYVGVNFWGVGLYSYGWFVNK